MELAPVKTLVDEVGSGYLGFVLAVFALAAARECSVALFAVQLAASSCSRIDLTAQAVGVCHQ